GIAAVQLVDVARLDPRPQQPEVLRHRAVAHVRLVGVPRQADGRVVAVLHDGPAVRRGGGGGGVDLDPDLGARAARGPPAGAPRQGISDLPICSRVRGTGTLGGKALGRTLTPRPPRSATSCTKRRQVSMLSRTTAWSGEWNSQTVTQPQMAMPASAKRVRTS